MIAVLAIAWGTLAALPVARRARRAHVADRVKCFARRSRRQRGRHRVAPVRSMARACATASPITAVVRVARAPRRRRQQRHHDDEVARELAIAVDLVGVGVAAGCTPFVAVEMGARWAPPLLAAGFADVVRACALGHTFDDALRDLGATLPAARPLTDTLRTTARLGTPVAPALGRLAVDVRADLRRRAEARARTVPVRLCFPLVGCILPAFALLTVVPVVIDGLHR